MKKLLSALVLVGVTAGTVLAAGYPVKANVPFDFTVGANELTAGEYTIEEHTQAGILLIRDANQRVKLMCLVDRIQKKGESEDPKLVFNRYGDRYFLSRVWGAGPVGAALHKSKIERELVASSATAPADQVVIVAAAYR